MIHVNAISFAYPGHSPVLHAVDLDLHEGGCLGLVGPNGAGKTTLISLLTGLNRPDGGAVTINGRGFSQHRNEILNLLAVVPQENAHYPSLSIIENLQFFSHLYPETNADLQKNIDSTLALTGLQGHEQRLTKHLSGGMKRRLNLAIGLLNRPRLLILDEPTTGIDPQSRHFILEAIKTLNKKGTTVIYTSHYLEEIEQVCDTIAIIDQGKILLTGKLDDLLSSTTRIHLQLDRPIGLLSDQLQDLFIESRLQVRGSNINGVLNDNRSLPVLMQRLHDHHAEISSMEFGRQTLESLFFKYTHTTLRE